MRARTNIDLRLLAVLAGTTLATACWWLADPNPAHAADAAAGEYAHLARIARQRPTCASPEGMRIVPNDPAALVTGRGTHCYGDGPPELELWLPLGRYIWLERGAVNPAAWVNVGPVVVDPHTLETPPLGLRLSAAEGSWTLETRHGQTATLTPLEPGSWHEVTSPDGQRFWIQVGSPEGKREAARGRVR
jgi:hypothetical protein